jgi:signal transduction histidine kinase
MPIDLEQLSISKKIILTILLLTIITILDFITGNEISFSVFYLIPITFAGWYISRNVGIFISLLSAVLWFSTDFLNNSLYSHNLIPYWNALVRLAFFMSVTYLLGLVKSEREREKEITEFVVHDLRSPLANILTSLKLLNEDSEEPPTQNQKELIELSISTGNRMMIFVNSLLDLGRLEKKKLPLNIVNVEVSKIINTAIEQVKLLAQEKNIDIKINCLIENIRADGSLLLRIIVNLLSNAIKVSAKNTQIQVTAEKLDEKYNIFSVKDHGPGIEKGYEHKLFEKYFQGSSKMVGSGIGLAFCKLAVEAHKGHIKLESDEGKGTTVFFILPIAQN